MSERREDRFSTQTAQAIRPASNEQQQQQQPKPHQAPKKFISAYRTRFKKVQTSFRHIQENTSRHLQRIQTQYQENSLSQIKDISSLESLPEASSILMNSSQAALIFCLRVSELKDKLLFALNHSDDEYISFVPLHRLLCDLILEFLLPQSKFTIEGLLQTGYPSLYAAALDAELSEPAVCKAYSVLLTAFGGSSAGTNPEKSSDVPRSALSLGRDEYLTVYNCLNIITAFIKISLSCTAYSAFSCSKYGKIMTSKLDLTPHVASVSRLMNCLPLTQVLQNQSLSSLLVSQLFYLRHQPGLIRVSLPLVFKAYWEVLCILSLWTDGSETSKQESAQLETRIKQAGALFKTVEDRTAWYDEVITPLVSSALDSNALAELPFEKFSMSRVYFAYLCFTPLYMEMCAEFITEAKEQSLATFLQKRLSSIRLKTLLSKAAFSTFEESVTVLPQLEQLSHSDDRGCDEAVQNFRDVLHCGGAFELSVDASSKLETLFADQDVRLIPLSNAKKWTQDLLKSITRFFFPLASGTEHLCEDLTMMLSQQSTPLVSSFLVNSEAGSELHGTVLLTLVDGEDGILLGAPVKIRGVFLLSDSRDQRQASLFNGLSRQILSQLLEYETSTSLDPIVMHLKQLLEKPPQQLNRTSSSARLELLFQCFTATQVLEVLLHMLLEKRILFISSCLSVSFHSGSFHCLIFLYAGVI